MSLLRVQNLRKTYGLGSAVEVHAVKDVTFSIEEGAFVALMGRSGSGKSTLMHQIGLIDTPTAGDIVIDGISVATLTEKQKSEYRLRHFGHIFQEYALIAELSAIENVMLPRMALTGQKDLERAENLLRLVELANRLDHYPHQLSGGEQQRVAIARALINEPRIVFADEPTANLDSVSAEVVLQLFKKLNSEKRQTIIMITHEPEDKKYVDLVFTLRDGLLE